jgi:hypothetical protein
MGRTCHYLETLAWRTSVHENIVQCKTLITVSARFARRNFVYLDVVPPGRAFGTNSGLIRDQFFGIISPAGPII